MLNPIRLCEDQFDDKNLSYADLRSFCDDHLVSLANPDNNPGGIYNSLIATTTTKYNSYFGKMTDEATKKSLAEGTTVTRNNARGAVEEQIRRMEGSTISLYGGASAEYQELFPLGMSEYLRAREGDVNTLFVRFQNHAVVRLNTDFPGQVTQLGTLISSFQTAFATRETVVNQVDSLQTGKHEDRKILTVQLTINFLTIAINNIDNPDRFDDYYDPRFLPLSGDNGIRTGTVNGGQVVHIPTSALTINGDTTVKLKVTDGSPLRFYFGPTETSAPDAVFIDVAVGADVETTAADLGLSPTNVFLLVQNNDAPSGKFRVEIG